MVASRGCSKALLRTLYLDPGVGGELEAYGELIPRAALDIPVSNIPRIFGLTSEGQSISLWDCHGAGCSYSMLRCTKQSFVILKAVVGLHCSETELKFTRTSLEYEHLGTWLRGFSPSMICSLTKPLCLNFTGFHQSRRLIAEYQG